MLKLPKKTTYLVVKGGRHYFRVRIPDDLRATFGKKEHNEALGDLNKAQAEVQAARLGADWQARFLQERHALGLAPQPPASPPTAAVYSSRIATLEEAQALAHLAGRSMFTADEDLRIEGGFTMPDVPGFDPGQDLAVAIPAAVSGRDMEGIAMQAEDWLGSHGLDLPTDAIARRRVLYAFATAMAKARKGMLARNEGEVVETPAEVPLPASLNARDWSSVSPADKPPEQLMLRDVFELWKVAPNRLGEPKDGKTIETAERTLGQFEKVCGNPPLVKLTRSDGLKFRDWLLEQGQSPRTANDRMGYVSRLIRFEMSERQRIQSDPWQSIKVQGSTQPVQKRKAIKAEKLVALFSIPLFQSYALFTVKSAGRDAAYWLPLLSLYTGARVTELAQLLVADVRQEGTLWCISILADGAKEDWQSIKNTPSKRLIPMHAELVRLGLPDYADALREAGHSRLFPLAPVSEKNNAGGPFSTWFSKLKTANGWGRENTFHSFRHTIETMLKRRRVPSFHINAYTGHQHTGGVADTGYTHFEVTDLVEVAEAVQHEGICLPRLFPPEGWSPPPLLDGLLMTQPRRKAVLAQPAVAKRPRGRPRKVRQ